MSKTSAYLKRWRRCHALAEAVAGAESDSSRDDQDSNNGQISDRESEGQPSGQELSRGSELDENSAHESENEAQIGILSDSDTCNWISDTSESEDEQLQEEQSNDAELSSELAASATRHKCTRSEVNDLLGILRKQGHRLPKDSRTLLQTPKNVEPLMKCGGQYLYFGIESGITKTLTQEEKFKNSANSIEMYVNIDGVPLFKSSNSQFWPILCSFGGFQPFLIALYYGDTKPKSLDEFLYDFATEFRELKVNGIVVDEKKFLVTFKAFICDAPARAFLKCVKSHTGYFACERCIIKGNWKFNRIVLHSTETFEQRTDEKFLLCEYNEHQCGRSPLIALEFPCVSGFCLDYMHLVCLGVVKRILLFLKNGPAQCKLSMRQIKDISDQLLSYCGQLPSDFARQPRSLLEMDRWKATEFRQFLLYTGSLVFKRLFLKNYMNTSCR